MAGNRGISGDVINSFTCRLMLKNKEAYMIEPSPEMCRFFGTTEDSYREGILHRIRKDISAKSADALEKLLSEKSEAGENFRIVYQSKRADGSACEMQLDGYPAEKKDGGYIYNIIEMDVTELVESRRLAEAEYNSAQSLLNSISDSYIATFRASITDNAVEMINGTNPLLKQEEVSSYESLLQSVMLTMTRSTDKERFIRTFSREALLNAYASGTTELSMDYLFRPDNVKRPVWVQAVMHLIRRPGSSDIIAFASVGNIDRLKTIEILMKKVLVRRYDFIASVDIASGELDFVNVNQQTDTMDEIRSGRNFDEITREYVKKHVPEESRAEYSSFFNLGNIVQALETEEQHVKTFLVIEDGKNCFKRIVFSYLDRESGLLAVTRTDTTEIQKEQAEHEAALSSALTAARQASSAKTNFLSRMSHEIRTPLNAIIGMDTIAAQNINSPERISDCISKIGISARFLLSLINDILDMSRIESGRMLLRNDRFRFGEFISGVNAMMFSQARDRGLDYECTVSSEIAETYIGDAMKLQQVLVNILGNAIKFTSRGKITMDIHPLSGKRNMTVVRFVVNDTGIGIREEMLERIFEPFEQGDTTTTATFSGTGLGLAITKNLVELMGGSVRVKSIVGIGSEFTVDIPLEVDEEMPEIPLTDLHFENMHTLIVDDDLIVCEQTINILRDIGMSGEWVTTGAEAVQRVRENYGRAFLYDYILVDWKMPDMDGIETTRQIRKIIGPDVTIIIITAYDWESIEVEARAAGANMLITKPLLKSSLVSAFKKVKEQNPESEKQEYNFDFTGCRVLLAEDNDINSEIAATLLQEKHFTVDRASNGLKALEMFTGSPVGTYHAILMDIRMPLMDGLQAAVNIRHWDRKDAKTIPIIAMTANAFDEDVEKSRAAGMNAHLSKPIEPNIMYATLERLIRQT